MKPINVIFLSTLSLGAVILALTISAVGFDLATHVDDNLVSYASEKTLETPFRISPNQVN
jgi:hypothetical protein